MYEISYNYNYVTYNIENSYNNINKNGYQNVKYTHLSMHLIFFCTLCIMNSCGQDRTSDITHSSLFSANTQRNKHIIIKSKRRFDVIITCLLHCVLQGCTMK